MQMSGHRTHFPFDLAAVSVAATKSVKIGRRKKTVNEMHFCPLPAVVEATDFFFHAVNELVSLEGIASVFIRLTDAIPLYQTDISLSVSASLTASSSSSPAHHSASLLFSL